MLRYIYLENETKLILLAPKSLVFTCSNSNFFLFFSSFLTWGCVCRLFFLPLAHYGKRLTPFVPDALQASSSISKICVILIEFLWTSVTYACVIGL